MPWLEMSVCGGILAEWREHYAVLEGETPNLERREEFGNCGAVGLRVSGCAGRGLLGGCEVGDLGLLD